MHSQQKKKICTRAHARTHAQRELAGMNSRICIAYCVRQQNGIAIINENIVGRFAKYDTTLPYASLIRYRYNGTAMAFCFLTFIIKRKENSARTCKRKEDSVKSDLHLDRGIAFAWMIFTNDSIGR